MSDVQERGEDAPAGQIARAIAVLEAVAEHGSSTARGIAEATAIPLPTVYRIAQELIRSEYLVHLRDEKRFALGYKLHRLAVGLHEHLGIPRAVREEVHSMHRDLGMAAYLAIHRGTDFVVVHVSDSPQAPRLSPLAFGFHESPHATAFGKAGLASLSPQEQEEYLAGGPLRAHTDRTVTDPEQLRGQLEEIAERGIAWEHQEFVVGTDCLAATIKADDGMLIGTVALSAPVSAYAGRVRHIEDRLRACASRAGRAYRLGAHSCGAAPGRPGPRSSRAAIRPIAAAETAAYGVAQVTDDDAVGRTCHECIEHRRHHQRHRGHRRGGGDPRRPDPGRVPA